MATEVLFKYNHNTYNEQVTVKGNPREVLKDAYSKFQILGFNNLTINSSQRIPVAKHLAPLGLKFEGIEIKPTEVGVRSDQNLDEVTSNIDFKGDFELRYNRERLLNHLVGHYLMRYTSIPNGTWPEKEGSAMVHEDTCCNLLPYFQKSDPQVKQDLSDILFFSKLVFAKPATTKELRKIATKLQETFSGVQSFGNNYFLIHGYKPMEE